MPDEIAVDDIIADPDFRTFIEEYIARKTSQRNGKSSRLARYTSNANMLSTEIAGLDKHIAKLQNVADNVLPARKDDDILMEK